MSEPRCDMCGPYTPEQAAAIVLGEWVPPRTGHYCAPCRDAISAAAQSLSDHIDAGIVARIYAESNPA